MVTIHKGCGGVIKDRVCQKCQHRWSVLGWSVAFDIEEQSERFNAKAYKRRIREGRDIFK